MITIRLGSTGAAVLTWQGIVGVGETGHFDAATESATRAWQGERGLDPDGVVGPATWGVAGVISEQRVSVLATPVTIDEFANALLPCWSGIAPEPCTRDAFAVLCAQCMVETGGGKSCWNWNLGNVKHVAGDGHDYCCLRSVSEAVTPDMAQRLVAAGQARIPATTNIAPPSGQVVVVFDPPHPATRFRAYASFRAGMLEHLRFLATHYPSAWQRALIGDPYGFALELGSRGYYTSSSASYANGMREYFAAARRPGPYDEALAEYLAAKERPTEPTIPPAKPTDPPGSRILHATVDFPPRNPES